MKQKKTGCDFGLEVKYRAKCSTFCGGNAESDAQNVSKCPAGQSGLQLKANTLGFQRFLSILALESCRSVGRTRWSTVTKVGEQRSRWLQSNEKLKKTEGIFPLTRLWQVKKMLLHHLPRKPRESGCEDVDKTAGRGLAPLPAAPLSLESLPGAKNRLYLS